MELMDSHERGVGEVTLKGLIRPYKHSFRRSARLITSHTATSASHTWPTSPLGSSHHHDEAVPHAATQREVQIRHWSFHMTRRSILCAAALLFIAAPACTSTAAVAFSPFNSVDAPPGQVTDLAIQIRPGDRPYLTKANPKVLGWVSSKGEPGDESISHAARVEAAKRGGTHILLRGSKQELDVEDVPFGPMGTQRIEESQLATFVVLRVSPEKWDSLPDVLRPKPLSAKSTE